jgi:hypothetical protein
MATIVLLALAALLVGHPNPPLNYPNREIVSWLQNWLHPSISRSLQVPRTISMAHIRISASMVQGHGTVAV